MGVSFDVGALVERSVAIYGLPPYLQFYDVAIFRYGFKGKGVKGSSFGADSPVFPAWFFAYATWLQARLADMDWIFCVNSDQSFDNTVCQHGSMRHREVVVATEGVPFMDNDPLSESSALVTAAVKAFDLQA